MKLTLLVSLNFEVRDNFSLFHKIQTVLRPLDSMPAVPEGVIPLGRNALLFDQTKSHSTYVQVCARLIEVQWPYIVSEVESQSFLVEGECGEALQAILDKSQDHFHYSNG